MMLKVEAGNESEQEVRDELQLIAKQKTIIEKRLWDTSVPVNAFDGTELSKDNIKIKIQQIAQRIIDNHPKANPVLLALLDGAMPFASALHTALDEIDSDYAFEFSAMQATSYTGAKSGELKIGALSKIPMGGRVVIVVDDVCDTGKTYAKIHDDLIHKEGAKEVFLVTLVDKVQDRASKCEPLYCGFKIPEDAFVIGYGLDYNGLGRTKKEIRAVNFDYLPNEGEKALLARESCLNKRLVEIMCNKRNASSVGNSPDALFAAAVTQLEDAVAIARAIA